MQNKKKKPTMRIMKNGLGRCIGVFKVAESESAIRISISVTVIEIFTDYCLKKVNYRG